MSKISRDRKKKELEEKKRLGLLPMDFCLSCQNEFPKMDLIYGPCPYIEEICGRKEETVLCAECYQQSCWDI